MGKNMEDGKEPNEVIKWGHTKGFEVQGKMILQQPAKSDWPVMWYIRRKIEKEIEKLSRGKVCNS